MLADMGRATRTVCTSLASAGLITAAAACATSSGAGAPPASSGVSTSSAAPATPSKPLQFSAVLGVSTGSCPTAKASYIVDARDGSCLRLAAPAVTVTHVRSAQATQLEGGAWAVQIVLQPTDQARFRALTEKLSRQPRPRNQLALVLGTAPGARLLTAPVVQSPITTGRLQITGGLTKSTAQRLVSDLGG